MGGLKIFLWAIPLAHSCHSSLWKICKKNQKWGVIILFTGLDNLLYTLWLSSRLKEGELSRSVFFCILYATGVLFTPVPAKPSGHFYVWSRHRSHYVCDVIRNPVRTVTQVYLSLYWDVNESTTAVQVAVFQLNFDAYLFRYSITRVSLRRHPLPEPTHPPAVPTRVQIPNKPLSRGAYTHVNIIL